MSEDKMDAVIVGGGLAGLCAAYRLLEAGRQVILLERGDACGSKNVTGGRIYVGPLRQYIPEILEEAPFERPVVKEIVTLLDEGSSVQAEYVNDKWKTAAVHELHGAAGRLRQLALGKGHGEGRVRHPEKAGRRSPLRGRPRGRGEGRGRGDTAPIL